MRARITLLVAATTSILLLAFLLPTAYLVSRVAHNNAVSRAQLQVQALIPILALSPAEASAFAVQSIQDAGYRVWITVPGQPTIGADPAGGLLDSIGQAGTELREVPATVDTPTGILLAQPVSRSDGVAVIRLLITQSQLTAGVYRIWAILGGIGAVLFLLSLAVADRLARSLTKPVRELSETARMLGGGELSTRVEPAGPPEIVAVGEALNQLGARITELLAAERESVADLSHRLRTPVTALKLDAQGLHDPVERDRLSQGVDELNRAVDEIIRTARRSTNEAPQNCDAAAVVRERLVFWSVLAHHQGRAVTATVSPDPLPVALAATDLTAALDALLGNVFGHTPEGAAFAVRCTAGATGGARIVIEDNGPGLTDDATVRGESGAGSTGLGLDIARQAARASGGGLSIGSRPHGGAAIVLDLGSPSAPQEARSGRDSAP